MVESTLICIHMHPISDPRFIIHIIFTYTPWFIPCNPVGIFHWSNSGFLTFDVGRGALLPAMYDRWGGGIPVIIPLECPLGQRLLAEIVPAPCQFAGGCKPALPKDLSYPILSYLAIINLSACLSICLSMYVVTICIYNMLHIYIFTCVCTYMYVCMYVCMYIIYIYIFIYWSIVLPIYLSFVLSYLSYLS